MKRICLALILSLSSGAVHAEAEQEWKEFEDWQVLLATSGCMAWTVQNEGPNSQLQIRNNTNGMWHIAFQGAGWHDELGRTIAASPFRDRSAPEVEITIKDMIFESIVTAKVQLAGDWNTIPHTDQASTTMVLSQLALGALTRSPQEFTVNGERIGLYSTNGFMEAMAAYQACEKNLVFP